MNQSAPASETAIIAPVPEADALLDDFRGRLDAVGVKGIPAHITVVYPFAPLDKAMTGAAQSALLRATGVLRPVDCALTRVGWFEHSVLYIAPEPEEWFRQATTAVHEAFPDYPPYGGVYADAVPHVTVAKDADYDLMRAAAVDLETKLPVSARIDHLLLMSGTDEPGSWHTLARLPLRDG